MLDAGRGTREHALMAAVRGLAASGIDTAPEAIAAARRKAAERFLPVRFLVGGALRLESLGTQFDTILDSGLFHVFDDAGRTAFVESVAAALPIGARYFVLCFSEAQPGVDGPRVASTWPPTDGATCCGPRPPHGPGTNGWCFQWAAMCRQLCWSSSGSSRHNKQCGTAG